jgi:uncharacterized protein involved in exopolysaccharide biosynthesis
VARLPVQQPFHEPIGISPEVHRVSRRWLATLAATVVVLALGVLAVLRMTGRI